MGGFAIDSSSLQMRLEGELVGAGPDCLLLKIILNKGGFAIDSPSRLD
jgi:hypothetical protein